MRSRPFVLTVALTIAVGTLSLLPVPVTAEKPSDAQLQVADILDGAIQPLFQDDTGKRFGLDRMTYEIPGHGNVRLRNTENVDTRKWVYVISFLHTGQFTPLSGKPADGSGTSINSSGVVRKKHLLPISYSDRLEYPVQFFKRWERIANQNVAELLTGNAVTVETGKWTLFLRPIKAGKASCVSCHSGAKIGDTLGVMAYAVAPKNKI